MHIKDTRTIVACPTYDGYRCNGEAIFTLGKANKCAVSFLEVKSSLLCKTFNTALGYALIEKQRGLTHLMIFHADIKPKIANWFDTMMTELLKCGGDMISAIVPIKDDRGITSTARDTDLWAPERYTMTEVMAKPDTWTADDLLFNTGMLLMDIRGDWVTKVCFTINDKIHFDEATNTYSVLVEPEDWNFSRQVRALGLKPYVTRVVPLNHAGDMNFANDRVWGIETDIKQRKYS